MSTADLPSITAFTAVVPVKSTGRGKSRIAVPVDIRADVASAMAVDTVTALAGSSVRRVIVAVDDERDASLFAELPKVSVMVVTADGLNPAIVEATAGITGPVAVVPGDLPSLTPAAVDEALTAAAVGLGAAHSAVVADESGSGTTFLAARSGGDLHPEYGVGSFDRHVRSGASVVDLPPTHPARRDVDTVADLQNVTGARTAAVRDAIVGGQSR